jgi:divalent metal cation (Fe/Co/Zn/Cd) transporter
MAQNVPIPTPSHGHGHGHEHALDPNAAWFALMGVIAKEWLYRITEKVAREEKSPVLHANALHHRSDAYSSVVALIAILGSWWFPALPLDPIGGMPDQFMLCRDCAEFITY